MTTANDRGSEVVRAALSAHSHGSLNITVLAKELGVAAHAILGFLEKNNTLPPPVMHGLVKVLFHGHAAWDERRDVLGPAVREPPKPLGRGPDQPPVLTSLPLRPAGQPPPAFPLPSITTGQAYSKPEGWE
jgi:hypothetical protein